MLLSATTLGGHVIRTPSYANGTYVKWFNEANSGTGYIKGIVTTEPVIMYIIERYTDDINNFDYDCIVSIHVEEISKYERQVAIG